MPSRIRPKRTGAPRAAQRAEEFDRPGDRDLATLLLRRQAALGLRVAVVFLLAIFGVPLLNYFAPRAMQWRIPGVGFTLSWFLVGVLFYPLTWFLSNYFVQASEKLEHEDARLIEQRRSGS